MCAHAGCAHIVCVCALMCRGRKRSTLRVDFLDEDDVVVLVVLRVVHPLGCWRGREGVRTCVHACVHSCMRGMCVGGEREGGSTCPAHNDGDTVDVDGVVVWLDVACNGEGLGDGCWVHGGEVRKCVNGCTHEDVGVFFYHFGVLTESLKILSESLELNFSSQDAQMIEKHSVCVRVRASIHTHTHGDGHTHEEPWTLTGARARTLVCLYVCARARSCVCVCSHHPLSLPPSLSPGRLR